MRASIEESICLSKTEITEFWHHPLDNTYFTFNIQNSFDTKKVSALISDEICVQIVFL